MVRRFAAGFDAGLRPRFTSETRARATAKARATATAKGRRNTGVSPLRATRSGRDDGICGVDSRGNCNSNANSSNNNNSNGNGRGRGRGKGKGKSNGKSRSPAGMTARKATAKAEATAGPSTALPMVASLRMTHFFGGGLKTTFWVGGRNTGSLHCAMDGDAVHRFGREDVG